MTSFITKKPGLKELYHEGIIHIRKIQRGSTLIEPNKTILTIIDVQGKLADLMYNKEELFKNLGILIRGAQALEIPILWMEQLPEKLGPTREEIAPFLKETTGPISKTPFSAWLSPEYREKLLVSRRTHILLCGIETHICVYQTALDLLERDFEVTLVADCASSRTEANRQIGIDGIRDRGGWISCTESVLFEALKTPEHPAFRTISKLVK
ncbi:MAG: isochorismatase family protein [Spirochaetales bacterium]|nr:isochorismatase family protein [Spirochaetales bacterium]